MTVQPSCVSCFKTLQTSFVIRESSPDVGSSRNKTLGRVTRASAMFTRLAWPPEMPRLSGSPMIVSRHFSNRRVSITSRQRAALTSLVMDRGNFNSAV
mmetsp:Transcript_58299/g.125254  ORF Transcript_58299/g.125254 Transcript_58299/m.125254 type:complete len:98 (+) Transcript_58299:1348-1641(+)